MEKIKELHSINLFEKPTSTVVVHQKAKNSLNKQHQNNIILKTDLQNNANQLILKNFNEKFKTLNVDSDLKRQFNNTYYINESKYATPHSLTFKRQVFALKKEYSRSHEVIFFVLIII